MKLAFRIIVSLIVLISSYFFLFWVPVTMILPIEKTWLCNIVSLVLAIGIGWFVWIKTGLTPKKLIESIFYGASILGSMAFAVGFFGPIIFSPSANQGPLLGIFITGPLGFILGGIIGLIYWYLKGRRHRS